MRVVFIKVKGGHAFEVRSANKRLLATSPTFRRKVDAVAALASMQLKLSDATVTEQES